MWKTRNCGFLILFVFGFSGCVSNSIVREDNPIAPVNNLYKRNFIVATATLAGNIICGVQFCFLHMVLFENGGGIPGEKTHPPAALYHVPATLCGAVTGIAFIPFSFICEKDEWDVNIKVAFGGFSCKKDP